MQLKKAFALTALSIAMLTGCASGLNSQQKIEYRNMQAEGLLVEEKNPGAGAALGILPGGGSFYVGEPGYGVLNLLLWPISIFWDPVSGYDGAQKINYDMTKQTLKRQKEKAMLELQAKQAAGEIDDKAYAMELRAIDQKYDFN
jgi:hypothetical protein